MSHFKIGDKVRRRTGTLGACGETGVVLGTNNRDGFELVTVRFPGRTETFHWDVYEHDENSSPYRIEGPALISFSGGRTSAYMLHEILRAHAGILPDDVHVTFANTGKEREETLRFVHDCSINWSVKVQWLEWRRAKPNFEKVGYNSASRAGEPFAELVKGKSYLPNWQARFCTQHLKIEVLNNYATSLGFVKGEYAEVIGLRHDEGLRIFKGIANAEKYGRRCLYPLSKAKVTKADIRKFWAVQPFDLSLEAWEGNCDLCFLKGRGLRKRIIRDDPGRADWWIEQERLTGGFFDRRDRYAGLANEVAISPTLFDPPDDEYDVECGLYCEPDTPLAVTPADGGKP